MRRIEGPTALPAFLVPAIRGTTFIPEWLRAKLAAPRGHLLVAVLLLFLASPERSPSEAMACSHAHGLFADARVGSYLRWRPRTRANEGETSSWRCFFNPGSSLRLRSTGALTPILLTWILSKVPLSRAYPFVASVFVVTPILANWLLGERISGSVMVGTALVMAGLMVVVYGQ